MKYGLVILSKLPQVVTLVVCIWKVFGLNQTILTAVFTGFLNHYRQMMG
jgi:hypothetical protein